MYRDLFWGNIKNRGITFPAIRAGICSAFLLFSATVHAGSVDLVVNVSADKANYTQFSQMVYTVEVQSSGPENTTGPVSLDVNIPSIEGTQEAWNTTVTCVAEGGAVCPASYTLGDDNTTLLGDIPSLPKLGKITLTIPVQGYSSSEFIGPARITAIAIVDAGDTEILPNTNDAHVVVGILVPDVELSFDISGPAGPLPENTPVTYQVTVTNSGNDPVGTTMLLRVSSGQGTGSVHPVAGRGDFIGNTFFKSSTCTGTTGGANCADTSLFWPQSISGSTGRDWPDWPIISKMPGNSSVTFDVVIGIGGTVCSNGGPATRDLILSGDLRFSWGINAPGTAAREWPLTPSDNADSGSAAVAAVECIVGDLQVLSESQPAVQVTPGIGANSPFTYEVVYTNAPGSSTADGAWIRFIPGAWPAPGLSLSLPTCVASAGGAMCPSSWEIQTQTITQSGNVLTINPQATSSKDAFIPAGETLTVTYTGTGGPDVTDRCKRTLLKNDTYIYAPSDFQDIDAPANFFDGSDNYSRINSWANVGIDCTGSSHNDEAKIEGPFVDPAATITLGTLAASSGQVLYFKSTFSNIHTKDFSEYTMTTWMHDETYRSNDNVTIWRPTVFDRYGGENYFFSHQGADPVGLPTPTPGIWDSNTFPGNRGLAGRDSGVRCTNTTGGALCPSSVQPLSPWSIIDDSYSVMKWSAIATSNSASSWGGTYPAMPAGSSVEFISTFRVPALRDGGTCFGATDTYHNIFGFSAIVAKTEPLSGDLNTGNDRDHVEFDVLVPGCTATLDIRKDALTAQLGADRVARYTIVLTNTALVALDLPHFIDLPESDAPTATISCTGTTGAAVCPSFTPVSGTKYLADSSMRPIDSSDVIGRTTPQFDFVWGTPGASTMPPGSTVTFEVEMTYPDSAIPSPSNIAYLGGDTASTTSSWPTVNDNAYVPLPLGGGLGVNKKVSPIQSNPGGTITYTLDLFNSSREDILQVFLSDTMHPLMQSVNPGGFGALTCRPLVAADNVLSDSYTVGAATCPSFTETAIGTNAVINTFPGNSGLRLTYTAIAPLNSVSVPNIAKLTNDQFLISSGDASAQANLSIVLSQSVTQSSIPVLSPAILLLLTLLIAFVGTVVSRKKISG